MNNDYTRHAYARAILEDLRRYLRHQYVATEVSPRKQLICEEVFYSEREIPQDAFLTMLERLERIEQVERDAMQQYEIRRRDPPEPPPPKEVVREQPHRENPPRKRRPEPDG